MRTRQPEERNVQQAGDSGDAGTPTPMERQRRLAKRDKAAGAQRGFAAMSAQQRRAIASLGGRAAHAAGVAHQFSSDEAREAGRKGGAATSRDRAHMAAIGSIGGMRRGQRRSDLPR